MRELQAEQVEAREGLRTLPGRRYRKRRHGGTATMSDESADSLRAKIADLEKRLTEAIRAIGEKEKELATT